MSASVTDSHPMHAAARLFGLDPVWVKGISFDLQPDGSCIAVIRHYVNPKQLAELAHAMAYRAGEWPREAAE